MRTAIAMLLVSVSCDALAQSPAPAFEVASVKASTSDQYGPMELGAERFRSVDVLSRLILWAYDLKDYQLPDAPPWFKKDWFEIQGKAAAPSSEDQMKGMVQTLLADRFRLKVHRETREIPVYALIVDKKGPKLKIAKDATQCKGSGCFGISGGNIYANGVTMALTVRAFTALLDRPAIDKTGLTGHYDFTLIYDNSSVKAPMLGMSNAPTEGPSIFAAVEDLGLKLEPQKAPVEFLVIDSVEHPSEN